MLQQMLMAAGQQHCVLLALSQASARSPGCWDILLIKTPPGVEVDGKQWDEV